jgi:hypothetical protein
MATRAEIDAAAHEMREWLRLADQKRTASAHFAKRFPNFSEQEEIEVWHKVSAMLADSDLSSTELDAMMKRGRWLPGQR